MTVLDRPAPDGTRSRVPLHSATAVGALAAAQAVVGSLLCVVCPIVGVWIAPTPTGAVWSEALRVAADGWLLAHGAATAVTGGAISIVPLGLSLVPAAWCWAAGRRMIIALRADAAGARAARRALASFAAVYAVLTVVVALLAASPVARPALGQALLGSLLLALGVTGAAMLHTARPPRRSKAPSPSSRVADLVRLPPVVRRTLPAAAVATALWVGAGAVLTAMAVLLQWSSVIAAHEALAPGVVGGLALVAGQLAYLPNLALWAGSWLAGPGFAVGTGTAVTPWETDLGALPAVPVLGALPGSPAAWLPVVLAVPVLAGGAAGVWLARRHPETRSWPALAVDAVICGGLTGLAGGLLAALAAGAGGPGRMAELGPTPHWVGLALAVEVAAGCLLGLLAASRVSGGPPAQLPRTLPKAGSWVRSLIQRS
jgi:hypothetical protein